MPRRAELQPNDRDRSFLEATLPHVGALTSVARHLAADPNAAEDLVQETYLRAYAAYDSHRGESTKAWLTTICVNLARDHGRRRLRRVLEAPLSAAGDPPAGGRGIDDEVIAMDEQAVITDALRRLPTEQRAAIVLMDIAGHSASEVGAILGCPRNTVLSRVHRGRRHLARILDREGVDRGLS